MLRDNEWHIIQLINREEITLSIEQFKKIFEPGFTTKKRGWGLGLSLTKRIVEEYHKGKIRGDHSEIGKGTTMVVSLKKT